MWTSKIRYQVKECSVLCMGRCKPLVSLDSFFSYAAQLSGANPVSLFTLRSSRWLLLASPSSSAVTMGGGSIPWTSFGSPPSQLETRNHWWLWHFLFIDMAGDIFISQTQGKNPILNIPVCSPWDVTSPVLTCSWSPDLDVSFKVGVCSSEKRDTVFLNLPKCSRAS